MNNKTIKIQEVPVNKQLLEKTSFCLVTGLFENAGYYVVASNDQIFIEKSWWEDENINDTLALTNNMNFDQESKIETSVSFNIDLIEESPIPVFGITIDDNYSIQQFNIDIEEAKKDQALNAIIDSKQKPIYWTIEKILHIGSKQYTEEQFKKHIRSVKTQGFSNPLVLYADRKIVRTYYYDIVPYLYDLLNCKTLPVRIITYKDIKYIEEISPLLYQELQKIPVNPYYAPENKINVSDMMIDNFSDKRDIIKSFMKNNNILDMNQKITLMDIDKLDEILPYFFTDKMSNKNKEFIDKLLSHEYPASNAFEKDHFMDSMSINESLYRYINGYAVIGKSIGTENVDFTSCKIVEEKLFDPALYPFDSFDYLDYASPDVQNIVKFVSDKFGSLCVHKDCPTQIIDIHNIHEALKDKNIRVKILGENKHDDCADI